MLWPSSRKHLLSAANLSQILQRQSKRGLSDLDLRSWTPPVLTTQLRLLSKSLIGSLPHPSCHHRRSQRSADQAEKMRCDVLYPFPRRRASCWDLVARSNHLRSSDNVFTPSLTNDRQAQTTFGVRFNETWSMKLPFSNERSKQHIPEGCYP